MEGGLPRGTACRRRSTSAVVPIDEVWVQRSPSEPVLGSREVIHDRAAPPNDPSHDRPRVLAAHPQVVPRCREHVLAKHYRRSPDELSVDPPQAYLAHMITKQGSCPGARATSTRPKRSGSCTTSPWAGTRSRSRCRLPSMSQVVPEILSREEVARLIDAPPNP